MNSPFMGRERENGRGLPAAPPRARTGTGAARWCGRRAPFAGMGEVFGKSVLSFGAGGFPPLVKGGVVYSPPGGCQSGMRRGRGRTGAQSAFTAASRSAAIAT